MDDWSGVQDPKERRKRQSRIRQRDWRQRKKTGDPKITAINADSAWQGYGMLITTEQHNPTTSRHRLLSAAFVRSDRGHQDLTLSQAPVTTIAHRTPRGDRLIRPLLPYTTDATLGRPTPIIIFPLSADHFLITLVQYNVLRAMLLNMSILSPLDYLPTECSRSFDVPVFGVTPPDKIPLHLQPTALQQSTQHPLWIKAIPFPAMRDNMILLAGKYDSDDLRYDLGQALYEGFDDLERRGFLVWGASWDMNGWEMSKYKRRKITNSAKESGGAHPSGFLLDLLDPQLRDALLFILTLPATADSDKAAQRSALSTKNKEHIAVQPCYSSQGTKAIQMRSVRLKRCLPSRQHVMWFGTS
ncbi:hypothetical protein V491_02962 [Pseudogymnoascus sp. VKM F-3775]|nr:hypothetical protein V491_02962 [Pseudogymnoascus sp. VKM F-3775]